MRKRPRPAEAASRGTAGSGQSAQGLAGAAAASETEADNDLVCVGEIVGAVGVRGEARLKSFCERPEAIADYSPLVSKDGREFRLEAARSTSRGIAARIEGVGTREEAQQLKGVMLYAERSRFAETDDDEYYQTDLIGVAVYTLMGKLVGKVSAVHSHGAGDILEIECDGGTWLVPFTRKAVPGVYMSERRIVVDEYLL